MTESNIDYCIGSMSHIYRFFDHLEKDFDVSASGRIGYINVLLDLIDFRKFKGVNFDTAKLFYCRHLFEKDPKVHGKRNADLLEKRFGC